MGAILKMRLRRSLYEPTWRMTGQRLDDEYPANEGQQQLLLDDDRDRADGAAERERADIAHKNLRRMRVIPEKSDGRANHGTAEDGHLRDLWHLRELEVIGENGVPADIRQYGKGAGGDNGTADRQAIEAVCKVDGIAGTNDNESDKRDERQKGQRRTDIRDAICR